MGLEEFERQIEELRRRVTLLEVDRIQLRAQIQELQERGKSKHTPRNHARAEEATRQAQLDREIEDALYEVFEFTPDHGYGLTPREILAGLASAGVVINDTELMQKRALARVLKEHFPEVKPWRNAEGRIYLGIKRPTV